MSARPGGPQNIWEEVAVERAYAHRKHGSMSMENTDPLDLNRLAILLEEVGEVASEFNEYRATAGWAAGAGITQTERETGLRARLRAELIQVAAMAGAWADALTEPR